MCFFHAVIQNRKKFGPIGWNIPYQFTVEDLQVSQSQLEIVLGEYKEVPYKVLNFICAEINYGGRVTDSKDLRLIKSLLENYLNPKVLRDNYKFSPSGDFSSLPVGPLEEYLERVQGFPLTSPPEVFLLHDNAEITTNENYAVEFISQLTLIESSAESSSEGTDKFKEIIDQLASQVPDIFDYQKIKEAFPTDYEESMNTVLI